MDTITRQSVPQAKSQRKLLQFNSAEEIDNAYCLECGSPLGITRRRVRGYASKQPFVVCMNSIDGEDHLLVRIPEDVEDEFIAYVLNREEANEAWVQRLTAQFEEAKE